MSVLDTDSCVGRIAEDLVVVFIGFITRFVCFSI